MAVATSRRVELRPMRQRDVPAVATIEAAVQPRPWSAEVFHAELERPDRVYLVAAGRGASLGRGRLLGYAGASVGAGEAHVLTVAIEPSARRQGVGTALVRALVTAVRARGAAGVTLEVRESNVAAQELYEGLGFVSYGLRPGYYQDTGEAARILWLHDARQDADAAGRG